MAVVADPTNQADCESIGAALKAPLQQRVATAKLRRDLMQPFDRDYHSVADCRRRITGDVTADFLNDVVEGQVPEVDQSLSERTPKGCFRRPPSFGRARSNGGTRSQCRD